MGKEPGAAALSQEEINDAARRAGAAGQASGAPQGRRPVRVRARRRGGGGARGRRRSVRGRARRDGRSGRSGVRGDPGHAPRRRLGGGVRDRPRGPREARVGARLGRARPLPRHARALHGHQEPAADRRAADGGGARSAGAGGGGRARDVSGTAHARRHAGGHRRAGRCRGRPTAGDHAGRPGGRAARDDRAGSSDGHSTARWWRSRAPARRRAGWPRGCASWAPRWSRRPRSGSSRARSRARCSTRCARIGEYALVCLTSPNGVRLLFDALRETGQDARALAGATVAAIGPGTAAELERHGRAGRRRARAVRGRGAGGGARDRWRWRAGACWWRVPRRRAASCPTRCASAAPSSTRWPSTRPSPSRSATPSARRSSAPPTSRSPPAPRCASCSTPACGRPTARAWSRSARSRARPPSEQGLTVDVEAERHDVDGLVDALTADAAARRVPA